MEAYQQGLAERGYVEGKNIAFEFVLAPTAADLPAFAARIVASKPDVILCPGGGPAGAAQRATSTIPIVFHNSTDPVGTGLVASLARPGGNVTGNSSAGDDASSKQVALLREIVPAMKRVAVLYLPAAPANAVNAGNVRNAAIAQGLEPVMIGFVDDQDLATQFQRVVAAGVQGAVVCNNFYLNANLDLLWELLVTAKIPAVAQQLRDSGTHRLAGVVSHGRTAAELVRKGVEIIDLILKGVKPADIPVQRPTLWDLAVDLTAARAIGITIPPAILAQATLVIE
jgi:putative ABC transport system substrate-binding protein